MADVTVINGAGKLADKLAKFGTIGEQRIQQAIAATTALTQEAIVDKITNDVRPHNRDGETVTNLVDTGAFRQSWQIKVEPGRGRVYTNIEYALALEYGTENLEGFGVVRDTSRKGRRIFVTKMREALKGLLE